MADQPITVAAICDRFYAINLTISGVHARRYFPENIETNSAAFPLLTVVPGSNTRRSSASNMRENLRDYLLIGIVGNFSAGLPTQSAQTNAEALINSIEVKYDPLNTLQLNGVGLASVLEVLYRGDSGIIQYPGTNLAAVIFTFSVKSQRVC